MQRCGAKAGFGFSMCNSCIQAHERAYDERGANPPPAPQPPTRNESAEGTLRRYNYFAVASSIFAAAAFLIPGFDTESLSTDCLVGLLGLTALILGLIALLRVEKARSGSGFGWFGFVVGLIYGISHIAKVLNYIFLAQALKH
jgi:hypothetical protein